MRARKEVDPVTDWDELVGSTDCDVRDNRFFGVEALLGFSWGALWLAPRIIKGCLELWLVGYMADVGGFRLVGADFFTSCAGFLLLGDSVSPPEVFGQYISSLIFACLASKSEER